MENKTRTRHDYDKQAIRETATRLTDMGFKVWIAERGTYGFFSDETETRVMSFQLDFGLVVASGNYEPSKYNGSGWQMNTRLYADTKQQIQQALHGRPPFKLDTEFTTVAAHLERYGPSSKFTPFNPE